MGCAALLAAFSAWLHWPLAQAGASFLISDWAHGYLEAEKLRLGDWTAFPYRHDYGGLTLGYVRALWSAGWDVLRIVPEQPWLGHMVFSYVVEPVLMTWAILALGWRHLGRLGAIVASLIACVGFRFWIDVYGNDFYVFSFCFGALLLAWRGRLSNPFVDLSPRELFVACALSGLALYTFRASAIFVAAFFLPATWTARRARDWLRPRDRIEEILVGCSAFLFGFYLYSFSGPSSGDSRTDGFSNSAPSPIF